MKTPNRQTGMILVTCLLMLAVLTLLTVAAGSMSGTDLHIAYNMQEQHRVEAAAQQVIEQVISTAASFYAPTAQTYTMPDGMQVSVSAPQCLSERPSTGYSAAWELAPKETTWEIVAATAADASTGARATLHQGVAIRLPAGYCL